VNTAEIADLWQRAKNGLHTAELLITIDADASASRSYYAAFHAVSAYFLSKDAAYTRHSAVEAAVHRDLVHAGIWDRELGAEYSSLVSLRSTGDYGGLEHISKEDALHALDAARHVVEAISRLLPEPG